ncbi:MAG: crotonase/enoyl-CoA hydratase family protein [Sphingosinicella sp.]|nr:crotonase/enoyl-CoA hydratase family protein [Sphingosinicella sp.]
MSDEILVSISGSISGIRFNRPETKNAITAAMYAALAEALDAAAADPKIRLVTIAAEGDIFTSGNDLKDFMAAPPLGMDQPVFRFLTAISNFPKPIVAAVGGAAIGVGTTLLLHCDLVIAAPGASFSLPFVDLALVPEAASSLLLPRLVGPQRAAKHLILGDSFDAATALAYGLVSEIVPEAELEDRLAAIAARIAAKPPEAVRITKALIKGPDEPVANRIAREAEAFAARLQSAEAAEAFKAFFERRSPNFT